MTTYSKICPKCQHSCDLAAATCKRCGLRFGGPPQAAPAGKPAQASIAGRATLVLAVIGLLVVVLFVQVFGAAQEKARRQKEVESNSWEAVMRRQNSGGK